MLFFTMCVLEDIPIWMRLLFRLHGVIQFPTKTSTDTLSKTVPRLWCIPLYVCYFYICVMWLTNSFATPYANEVMHNVEITALLLGTILMGLNIVVFYRRNNSLHLLLLKINDIKVVLMPTSSIIPHQSSDWLELIVFVLYLINIIFAFFFDMAIYFLFCYIPITTSCLNHVFLSKVLANIRHQFDVIDQYLQKQINCVDLHTIFPFTKVEKIRELKEAEKSFNIYRMEELSLLHYDLVNLAVAVSRLFDVTTMVAMVVWFVWVIDTFYMLVIFAVNQIQMESPFINLFMTTSSLFFLVWFFLMVRMYSRTQQTVRKWLQVYKLISRLSGE
jgi:hypothetical protein